MSFLKLNRSIKTMKYEYSSNTDAHFYTEIRTQCHALSSVCFSSLSPWSSCDLDLSTPNTEVFILVPKCTNAESLVKICPIKHYIPIARHTLQTSYSFTQLQSLRVHLPLSYFSFHVITYHLVHGLSGSLPLKSGIPYLFTLGNHNHSPHSDAT